MAEIIDTSGVPDKSEDCVQRGIQIANGMVSLLGLNLMQACAIVGYCMKESSCKPSSYNKNEAAGGGVGYANGPNCGEGIAQWTNVAYKDKNLAMMGWPTGGHPGNISSLSLDQQIQMLAKGSLGQAYMKYGLNTATSWDSAVACACIQGHGSGYAQSAYNEAGGNINSETYVRACMSKYAGGRQDLPRAKKWGQQVFAAMGGKPGDYGGVSGGDNHNWPDFNLKDFPIMSDEQGRYTEEPIGWGVANHLRISSGGYGGELDMGGSGEGFAVAGEALASDIVLNGLSSHVMTHCPGRSIQYLAIHYTAGGSSKTGRAMNMKDQWEKGGKASADFGVDDGTMVQFNPDPRNWNCWAVGGHSTANGGGGAVGASNRNSISIEMCSSIKPGTDASTPNHEGWYYTDAVIANGIKLSRFLMKTFNIPRERVIRHYDVSGKLCPGIIGWNNGPLRTTSGAHMAGNNNSQIWEKFRNSL